jgi:hypothetical protein
MPVREKTIQEKIELAINLAKVSVDHEDYVTALKFLDYAKAKLTELVASIPADQLATTTHL